MTVERSSDHFLSGLARLEGFHGAGRVVLPALPRIPKGGDVRIDVADQAIVCFCSGQYRRGSWTRKYAKLHSVPSHRTGFVEGIGDASAARGEGRNISQRADRCTHGPVRGPGKNASSAHSFVAAKRRHMKNAGCRLATEANRELQTASGRQFAIRYSPLAIRSNLLLAAGAS
jgi:hypothetical protein